MKQRIITAILMALVVFPTIIYGGLPLTILTIVAALLSGYEIVKVYSGNKLPIHVLGLIVMFLISIVLFDLSIIFIEPIYIIALLLALLILPIFDESFYIENALYLFTMTVLVGIGLHMLIYVRLQMSTEFLFFIIFASSGSDVGAYFTGYFFGKHKLIPRLSPKKTVEGAIGGVIIGTIAAILFSIVTGIFDQPAFIIVTSIILTMTSQIGDLVFSSIKRYFNIKDYSNMFPGHGGLLDRIDSILFNVIIFGLLTIAYVG